MSLGIRHLVILASTLGVFSQLTALTVRGTAGYNYVATLSCIPLLRGDMCSAMDSSSAVEGHAFGQRQPPLYVTIKKILDKYPDGQIFKVCQGNIHRTTL